MKTRSTQVNHDMTEDVGLDKPAEETAYGDTDL